MTDQEINDPRNNYTHFDLPIDSPCCGPSMLAWGRFYGAKVYICRNCMNFVERKEALPLVRKARRMFRSVYRDAMIREIPAYPHKQGDTIKWK